MPSLGLAISLAISESVSMATRWLIWPWIPGLRGHVALRTDERAEVRILSLTSNASVLAPESVQIEMSSASWSTHSASISRRRSAGDDEGGEEETVVEMPKCDRPWGWPTRCEVRGGTRRG